MQHEILNRIAAIPGVASVAFTSRLPMETSGRTSYPLFAEGKADDGRNPVSRQVRFISPGILRTLGTPLIVGGDFTWIDILENRDVAMLSENLAREMWGSPAAAVGKRIREANGVWREVVGVTGDIYDEGVDQPPRRCCSCRRDRCEHPRASECLAATRHLHHSQRTHRH